LEKSRKGYCCWWRYKITLQICVSYKSFAYLQKVNSMENSIKKITIKNLWGKDITWELNSDVNILVGSNGFGKSTILNMIEAAFSTKRNFEWDSVRNKFSAVNGMEVVLNNDSVIVIDEYGERTFQNLSINNTFELDEERLVASFRTELIKTFDFTIAEQKEFLKSDNELDTFLSNKLKKEVLFQFRQFESEFSDLLLAAYEDDRTNQIDAKKRLDVQKQRRDDLINKIKSLFESTEKEFDRKLFAFKKKGQSEVIDIERLSSGEKQILYILFKVFFQHQQPYILLLDEPEVSLDIDWQKLLINYIRELNPNCQVIVATHSPSMFYLNWSGDYLFLLDELLQPTSYQNRPIVTTSQENLSNYDRAKIEALFSGISRNQPNDDRMRLIAFNQRLNNFYEISLADATEILRRCESDLGIAPDVITYTTLISRVNTLQEAEVLIQTMDSKSIRPNEYTMNNLIKKTTSIYEALEKLNFMKDAYNLKPDIIAFSTILGKSRNSAEAKEVDKMRIYYNVEANPIYTERLKHKI